ncbi:MAG: hypothetical protein QOK25_2249 [Thermoleophilaceae bacterium]|nr:hypothetical protein [Thermoleophilaceae bacterium]
MTAAPSAPRVSPARRVRAALRPRAPELLLTLLFVVLVAPVIASGGGGPAGAVDEARYHLPTILTLSEQLPRPDLVHIHTATSPGFHLVLAVVARVVGHDRALLEAFGALFSLAMVLVAFGLLARHVDRWLAFALTLPLLFSHYVLQSAAWLNTDNAAVLFVLLTVGVALRVERTGRGFVRGGAYLFCAVWVRQLALWAAGPFLFAAALAGRLLPGLRDPDRGPRSYRPLMLAGAAVVPALASLAALAATWGQLTPPATAQQSGTSPAAFPFTLALVGMFGLAFAACAVTRDDLLRGRAVLVAAIGGAALALAVPTSETTALQRRTGGGLWKLVHETPIVAHRSPVIALLAAVGGVVLLALWRAASRYGQRRPAAVLLVAMLSLAAAQAGTVRTYQRYFEPALLVLLALLVTLGPLSRPSDRQGHEAARRRTIGLMAALASIQLVGVVTVVYDAVL